jgi:hypothetical protein
MKVTLLARHIGPLKNADIVLTEDNYLKAADALVRVHASETRAAAGHAGTGGGECSERRGATGGRVDFAYAKECSGDMCERAEVTACANASALGDDRVDAVVEEIDEALQRDAPDTAEAAGESLDPQEHHASDNHLRQRVPNAAGMGDHEPVLQLLCIVCRDARVAIGAEAGGDTVDALSRAGGAGNDVGGAVYAEGRIVREFHLQVAEEHRFDLRCRQRKVANHEFQHLSSGAWPAAWQREQSGCARRGGRQASEAAEDGIG